MSGESNLIDIECALRHQTAAAYLVEIDGEKYWVPKSQCEYDDGVLTIPEWLANDKGMI